MTDKTIKPSTVPPALFNKNAASTLSEGDRYRIGVLEGCITDCKHGHVDKWVIATSDILLLFTRSGVPRGINVALLSTPALTIRDLIVDTFTTDLSAKVGSADFNLSEIINLAMDVYALQLDRGVDDKRVPVKVKKIIPGADGFDLSQISLAEFTLSAERHRLISEFLAGSIGGFITVKPSNHFMDAVPSNYLICQY